MTNKVIGIEYTLYDTNTNEKLDTNIGSEPLEFISGQGQIIPGLENELINLKKDDTIEVIVSPEDAYGIYNQEAIQTLPKEQFAGVDLELNQTLYGTGENGDTVQVIVKDIQDDNITIDYNHPMAGKTLTFKVLILSVREATTEELETGTVGGLAATGGCGCGSNDGGCGSHN